MDLLLTPFSYFIEPSKRLFWLFLISALVMASLSVTIQSKKFDLIQQLKSLLNRRYWLNISTATDVFYVFINNTVRLLLITPLIGSHLAATIFFGSLLQTTFGDAPTLAVPAVWVGLLYACVFFILEDFSRFGVHYAMHKLPWLWRFHKVHHSATVLTPLTVHRVHPIEMSLYTLRGFFVFGVVSGVFVYLFKDNIQSWQILGVDILGFLFNVFGANLRHSHIRLSFGKLERWLISPAQHQIHHSNAPEHRDKNLGVALACWDRWFNTWAPNNTKENLTFGLVRQG
ncbi:sterol desaturase family protein [Marinibactrum halimedae]|nr:sterol desaturase family protein [Marinibactrum halimedae]